MQGAPGVPWTLPRKYTAERVSVETKNLAACQKARILTAVKIFADKDSDERYPCFDTLHLMSVIKQSYRKMHYWYNKCDPKQVLQKRIFSRSPWCEPVFRTGWKQGFWRAKSLLSEKNHCSYYTPGSSVFWTIFHTKTKKIKSNKKDCSWLSDAKRVH